jgi:chondroitin AC lyase
MMRRTDHGFSFALRRLAALLVCALLAECASASDLDTLRQRMIDGEIPDDTSARQDVVEHADTLVRSIENDGTWKAIDYSDKTRSGWALLRHLRNTLQLAKANRISRDARRNDAALLSLRWWLKNDPQNPNWWHNQIGVPELLGQIALLLGESLSPGDRAKIIKIMQRSKGETWTGQNQVWTCGIHIVRGVVSGDDAVVSKAYQRLYQEVRIAPPQGEGIVPDFSFHQHGAILYSGGYGLAFGNDVGRFILYAWGTGFQPPRETMDVYTSFMLDGQRWMTRGSIFDYSATGREITRRNKRAVSIDGERESKSRLGRAHGMANVVRGLASLDLPRKSEFAEFADQLAGRRANSVTGNRHFSCSDYMVHQRPEFLVSIRMHSSRTLNTELVNNEGKQSHFLGDGCTLIYRTGEEYYNLFPIWDWKKIPGTTAVQAPFESLNPNPQFRTKAEFVGGVSDGICGAAAQDLAHGKLSAKKFWMFHEDGFSAMGAGITCEDENPVVTTLDQSHLVGSVNREANRVTHNGLRYVVESPAKIECSVGEQQGRWSDIGTGTDELIKGSVFKMWIDHGIAPRNASYVYHVVSESASPDATVLSNTPALQALTRRGVLAAVFWEAGRLELDGAQSIAVDQPCLLLKREGKLTLANPKNAVLKVNVTLDGSRTMIFDLPGGGHAGSSVTLVEQPK